MKKWKGILLLTMIGVMLMTFVACGEETPNTSSADHWAAAIEISDVGDAFDVTIDEEEKAITCFVPLSIEAFSAGQIKLNAKDLEGTTIGFYADKKFSEKIGESVPLTEDKSSFYLRVSADNAKAVRYLVNVYHSDFSYETKADGTYEIARYEGKTATAVIPSAYLETEVTSVAKRAFAGSKTLTSVSIPSSVKSIGENAFDGCVKLKKVYAEDLTAWCEVAFGGAHANPLEYAHNLYLGTALLTDLSVPDAVTEIKNYAFSGATCLTTVSVSENVSKIGANAFSDCSSLTEISIPKVLRSIGSNAFSNCDALSSVYYAGDVATWCVIAFSDNPLRTADLYIGGKTLSGKIVLPSAVSTVPAYTFRNSHITSITLPEGLKSIGTDAFSGCYQLVEVCNKSSLAIEKGTEDYGSVARYAKDVYTGNYDSKLSTDKNGYILYADGSDVFLVGYAGSATELTVPEVVTEINEGAFYKDETITKVTIPDDVMAIGKKAFFGCGALTRVVIGKRMRSIEEDAFAACYQLVEVCNKSSLLIEKNDNYGGVGRFAKEINRVEDPTKVSADGNGYVLYRDGGTVSLIGYTGRETALSLPQGVTEINECAFYDNTKITSVSIPSSVTRIGGAAFAGCTGLSDFSIPSTVKSIGPRAFEGCSFLQSEGGVQYVSTWCVGAEKTATSVSVKATIKGIADEAFYHCDNLSTVTIANSVVRIGMDAFADCAALTKLTLGSGVTLIGERAFENCSSLTALTLPAGVTEVKKSAFAGCTALATVTYAGDIAAWCKITFAEGSNPLQYAEALVINKEPVTEILFPETVKEIKEYAFYHAAFLTSVTIPETVISIGKEAFSGCGCVETVAGVEYVGTWAVGSEEGISTASVRAGTKGIAQYAFFDRISLATVEIADSVTIIDSSAFEGCSVLTGLTFGDGLASIGTNAFADCTSLTEVLLPVGLKALGSGAFGNCPIERASIPLVAYPFVNNARLQRLTITAGNAIGESVFANNSSIKEVTIESGITTIGNGAFENCRSLTNLTIGDCVVNIGENAFLNCSSLTDVTIGNGLKNVGYAAFMGCPVERATIPVVAATSVNNRRLTTVAITSGQTVPDSAFAGCVSLISVELSEGIERIEWGAFSDCSALTDLTIPAGVKTIGSDAFSHCESITSVEYAGDVDSWCGITFGNRLSNPLFYTHEFRRNGELVTDLTIDSADSIGNYAFVGVTSLTTVCIGSGVKRIGIEAFCGCESLVLATIPDGVTEIGEGAFADCVSLREITVPDSVTTLGGRTFNNCSSLVMATIGSGVTKIAARTFYGCSSLRILTIPFVGEKAGVTSADKNQYPIGYLFGTYPYTNATKTNQRYYSEGNSLEKGTDFYIPSSLFSVAVTGGYVPYGAFYNCGMLREIDFGDGVTSIGSRACYGCSHLLMTVIGSGVTSIGNSAFDGCDEIVEVYNRSSLAITMRADTFGGVARSAENVFVDEEDSRISVDENGFILYSYFSVGLLCYVGEETEVVLPSEVEYIDHYAFYNTSVTDVTIPDSVWRAEEDAFAGCSIERATIPAPICSVVANDALRSVVITGDSLIGSGAFAGCSSLTDVTIIDTVTTIGYGAFAGCPIENATIPAFACAAVGNESLRSVVITSGESIEEYAFSGCTSLISVTIPDSVTAIDERAFENCSSLTDVTIPDSVATVGNRAFDQCPIKTATIPACVAPAVSNSALWKVVITSGESIEEYAFSGCTSLISVTIPETVTSIGNDAFRYCSKLIEVYNKSSLEITIGSTENGYVGFYVKNVYTEEGESKLSIDENGYILYTDGGTISLVGYAGNDTVLTLPAGITEIYKYAFYQNGNVTVITIPDSVTRFKDEAFGSFYSLESVYYTGSIASWCEIAFDGDDYSCNPLYGNNLYINNELVTDLVIPSGVTTIKKFAFAGANSIKSVTIPDSVTTIEQSAFEYSGLTSVTIPDSVTSIGRYAFYRCSSLTRVTIGEMVNSIGDGAFNFCERLWEVCNKSSLNVTIGSSDNGYVGYYALEISTVETDGKVFTEGDFVLYRDGENVSLIEYNGTSTELTLPKGITEIRKEVFRDRWRLTSVTIPDGVRVIGDEAFYGCSELTSLSLPDSLTNIGDSAFRGCSKLLRLRIPDNVTSVGGGAFYACTSLRRVTIGSGVNTIESYTFYSCSSLMGVTIPEGVTAIGEYAFSGCSSLANATIPDSVTSIGERAFYNCRNMTNVTIGSGVASIGNSAFNACVRLCEVYNRSTLTITAGSNGCGAVGQYALNVYTEEGGSKLSVDSNGYVLYTDEEDVYLIAYTGTNQKLTLPNGITKINDYALYGNTTVTSAIIPDRVTNVGYRAFDTCSNLVFVTIGSNVASIGDGAFSGCKYLYEVYNRSALPITKGSYENGAVAYYALVVYTEESARKVNVDSNGYVIVTDGEDVVLAAYLGSAVDLILPQGITEIYQYLFDYRYEIRTVTIPSSVTKIGSNAFRYCLSLSTIYYGGTMEQWAAIEKESNWNAATVYREIRCSDGVIPR